MAAILQAYPTVGEIGRQLCQPIHRIDYVIRSRGIKPAGRAGIASVYTEADVAYIASEIRRIDRERLGL